MAYLCVAVTKEVVKKEIFKSKEEALGFFRENYEEHIRTWMSGERKRIKAKLRDYERRIEMESKQPGAEDKIKELYDKMEKSRLELEKADRWDQGEMEKESLYWYEKFNQYKGELIAEEPQLFLHMAGVFKEGGGYKVTEEKYYSMGWLIDTGKGTIDVMKRLPERSVKESISLHICKDSEESRMKLMKKISKERAQICQSCRKRQKHFKQD